MGPVKPREERRTTFLRARIRTEHGWSDVTIGNVSSRGLMLQAGASLQRNCFIEIRHGNACIVGRIVWARGVKCGVRTQDAVDIAALLSRAPAERATPGEERRAAPRQPEARRVLSWRKPHGPCSTPRWRGRRPPSQAPSSIPARIPRAMAMKIAPTVRSSHLRVCGRAIAAESRLPAPM